MRISGNINMRCKVNKKLSETASLGMIYFNGFVSLSATPYVRVCKNLTICSLLVISKMRQSRYCDCGRPQRPRPAYC